MAQINQINESAQTVVTAKSQTASTGKAGDFENALSKAFDKTQAEKMESQSSSALGEIASAQPNVADPSEVVSGKTDQLLDMLEAYSSKLQDPEVSLKTIEPVLEEIQQQAGSLMKEAQSLAEPDEALGKIAAQTVVTAQTEYIKFQRGDYTS